MIAPAVVAPEQVAQPTVALFSEKAVGYLTFFLGAPAGFSLVAYNWYQLGQTGRVAQRIAAALATVLGYAVLWGVAGEYANGLTGLIGLIFVVVLRSQAGASEYYASAAGHQLTRRKAWLGAAIGLVALIATVVIAFPLSLAVRVLLFNLTR